MSLDIAFISRKNVICPHCNNIVKTEDIDCVYSGGRYWHDILESLGYYVPHDQITEENDWYGKDMTLTTKQAKQVCDFVKDNPYIYNADKIISLIAVTILNENMVVINADW